MTTALLLIDVQNDFTEGGALGVEGGAAVAAGIARLLAEHPDRYDVVIASRDWHDGDNDNGGHFHPEPDFVDSWPVHCVAGTPGAAYHPDFPTDAVDLHVHKGQGRPAYSIFEGTISKDGTAEVESAEVESAEDGTAEGGTTEDTAHGHALRDELDRLGVTDIDVAGIATDYCVLASALDALETGRTVTVLTDLIAGVDPGTSAAALERLAAAGARLAPSAGAH